MLNSKPIFLNRCSSSEKNTFADNSRVEPTIFLMEKLSFSLKFLSGDFYGQSFIETVRGPLHGESYKTGIQAGFYFSLHLHENALLS